MATGLKKVTREDMKTERWHQSAREVQRFGDVTDDLPNPIGAKVRADMCKQLNVLLADTLSLRDLYKKCHWQVGGPTFYQLHLLFDKHFDEQVDISDKIAERIQLLGGVSVAMGDHVAQLTELKPPQRGKEEVPVQIARLLEAHRIIMKRCHDIASAADDAGDDGTNDLCVSNVLRPNELQSWFVGQHLVAMPLTEAQ
jgi:starvation-inducible DNA-binding protein